MSYLDHNLTKPFKSPVFRTLSPDDSQATQETPTQESSQELFTYDTPTNPKLNKQYEFPSQTTRDFLENNNPSDHLTAILEEEREREEKRIRSIYFENGFKPESIRVYLDDQDEQKEKKEKEEKEQEEKKKNKFTFVNQLRNDLLDDSPIPSKKRKTIEDHDRERKKTREEKAHIKIVKYEMIEMYQRNINQFENTLTVDSGIDFALNPIFVEYYEEKNELLLDYLGHLDGLRIKTEREFRNLEKNRKKTQSPSSPTF